MHESHMRVTRARMLESAGAQSIEPPLKAGRGGPRRAEAGREQSGGFRRESCGRDSEPREGYGVREPRRAIRSHLRFSRCGLVMSVLSKQENSSLYFH